MQSVGHLQNKRSWEQRSVFFVFSFVLFCLNDHFMHIFRTHTLRFTRLSRKRGTNRCKATMQTQTGGDVQQQKHGGKQERGKKGGKRGEGAQTARGTVCWVEIKL